MTARRRTRRWAWSALAALGVLAPLESRADWLTPEPGWDTGWSVTAFHGWYTDDNTFGDALFFEDIQLDSGYRFLGVALNKRLATLWPGIELEGEVELFGHYRDQRHGEVVGLLAARWRQFPWDRWLQTGVAFGVGLSAATEEPEYEIKNTGRTNKLLVALMVEAEVGLARYPSWTLVGRIHHRSTALNLMSGANVGSNAYALGIKYRFR